MNVELPDALAVKVVNLASKRGMTVDAVVVEAVEKAVSAAPTAEAVPPRRRLALSRIAVREMADALL